MTELLATADEAITSRLAGKTFAANGTLRASGVWDVDRWCADVNLTSHAIIVSNRAPAIAITKRHVMLSEHYADNVGKEPPIDYDFLTEDNTVINRTVVREDLIGPFDSDIAIGLLDSDLPATITPAVMLPADYQTYLPDLTKVDGDSALGPLCFATDLEDNALVDQWRYTFSASLGRRFSVIMSPPVGSAAIDFFEIAVGGDSGSPVFMFVPILGSLTPVLVTAFYRETGGTLSGPDYGNYIDEIDAMIAGIDVAHGISTGYTVTEADFSEYATFEIHTNEVHFTESTSRPRYTEAEHLGRFTEDLITGL